MVNIARFTVDRLQGNKLIKKPIKLSPATIACNGQVIEVRYPKFVKPKIHKMK